LAGAFYGLESLPKRWRDLLCQRETLRGYAQVLCEGAGRLNYENVERIQPEM
jgi:hypothetical protein